MFRQIRQGRRWKRRARPAEGFGKRQGKHLIVHPPTPWVSHGPNDAPAPVRQSPKVHRVHLPAGPQVEILFGQVEEVALGFKVVDDGVGARLQIGFTGIHRDLGIQRRLVGGRYTGELRNLSRSSLLVQPLGIT